MTKQVQLRRGTTSEHLVFTGAVGELTIDTNLDVAVVHDGSTVGGHYLVGVAATQNIINKVSVGIGTSGTDSELGVIGNAYIAGNLTTRSLFINYEEPVVRSGIISATPNNIITGIATNDIRVGYSVTNTTISVGTTVVSIGIGSITISNLTSDSQISTSLYVATSNGNHLIEPYIGINTSLLAVGYAVSGPGVLPNTTISSLSSFLNGSVFLSQNTTGTVGVITASGTVSSAGTIITGITTTNLVVGYSILFDPSSGTPNNTQIVSINAGQITVNNTITVTGTRSFEFGPLNQYYFSNLSISTSFSFVDPVLGSADIDVITAQEETVSRLNVTNESNSNIARVNVGIITEAYITSGIITNSGLGTAVIQNAYINVGIGTTVGISSARLDQAYISSGIATNLVSENLIVQNFNADTSVANTSYINIGIGTTVGISSLRSNNLYVDTGIATVLGVSTATVNNLYVDIGIATNFTIQNLSLTDLYANTAYINTGIITTVGITSANIDLLNLDSGIATSFNVDTSSITNAYITNGISSTFNITDTYIASAYINAGIITTGNVDNLHSSEVTFGVGIGTTAAITEARIDTLYVNSGILTSSRVGFSTLDTAFISTSRTNVGFATYFDVTGVGTIQRLESPVGFITYLSGSDINYSGLSTFGNVTIGIGNTDLIVSGDTRITGILSVGSGTVTINGENSSVSGIESLRVATGFVTTLSGTDVNYSGVSTFNKVGLTTLSFVGINTLLNNQDKTVKIELSNSGVATAYTLTLPAVKGTAGQLLGVLPDGTLGFTTNGAGLFESRYYVSAENGNDTYNGRSLPVKTIKRAAQLASFDSFVIPGQRYLDAGDLLENNREFIKEETIAYVQFNYENIGITTIFDDFDAATWKSGIGSAVDAITYDVRFGGNSRSRSASFDFYNQATYSGEEEPFIFALDYVKFISQYVINNQSPPTLYQTEVSQIFDFTIIQDPENSNTNYFHRSKDARNLIVGNRQEIIDKSLASVAVGVGSTFFFPGEIESNVRSRYYDSYKLITINKQEILDKSLASVAVGFPSSWYFPGDSASNGRSRYYDSYRLITQNKREIVDKSLASVAVYVDSSNGFYFPGDTETNPRSRYYDGYRLIQNNKQEVVDKSLASIAIGFPTGFYVPGPGIGSTTKDSRYYDAYRLIQINKDEIVATALTAISVAYPTLWSSGVSSDKCARDLGYFVDAVSTDVFTGGNSYANNFTRFYFVGIGSTSLAGEEQQTIYGFQQAGIQMRNAITNQLTNKNLGISSGPTTYTGTKVGAVDVASTTACTDVQNNITTLVGIVTAAIGVGNTSGLPTLNVGNFNVNTIGIANTFGIWRCARDLGYFVDAISADVFTGGNSYAREFTGFYFVGVGTTGLAGEEGQSIYAFRSAGSYMKSAITNQLNYQDRGITVGPSTYNGAGGNIGVTSTAACTDVQNNVDTLVGIVTVAVGAGNTTSLPTVNYGYFASVGVGSTSTPGGRKCARDLGYLVDAVATDVFTGGNKYSREFALFYFNNGNPTGIGSTERDESVYAFKSASTYMQLAITNNLNYQNLYVTPDPVTNYNRSTASCANVRANIDSLVGIVTVTIGAGTSSGIAGINTGYYDVDKLLISGSAAQIASSGIGSTSSPGSTKCARDLSLFIEAVSTDVFTGGNNYSRSFTGFYFNNVGNPISNGLVGETVESNYAFEKARDYMKLAVTNQLNNRDLTITADPVTGFNTDPGSCTNVQSTITTLTGIVTTAIGSGSTAGIGTTTNYGYFLVNSSSNVRDSVGIGTTNVVGGRKCARDLGYIVDAIAQDVSYGTNQHTIYATKKYFNGAGTLISNGLLGEENASVYAFKNVGTYAKRAVTNWLNYQDLTINNDVAVGSTNKNTNVCANTRSTIDSLVGILTSALLSGSIAGITTLNLGSTDCADVRTAIVNYVGIMTNVVGFGTTVAPELNAPQTQSKPVCIFVEAGEYIEDNPILLYDDVAIVGDNLRNTIIRPLNAGKDLFRVRNGVYVTGFAMKDSIDAAGIPLSTWDYAVAFDDPNDPLTSRAGYATKGDKPIITRSPYIQNCSILSFLGANGILVDGNKVNSPNIPVVKQEAEVNADLEQPEQGKSMVAAAFTMVSFGGIGWRTINDGYAQVVSCFQIFCRYGSLTQSGGYLSITNSATNFGFYALRSTGFSPNSFIFDRGRISATGTSGGLTTLKVVGLGRSDQDLYVARFFNNNNQDVTSNFKASPVTSEFVGTSVTAGGAVNISANTININSHPFSNQDSLVYLGDEGVIPARIIGGLVNQNQYYVQYVDSNSFRLAEDEGLSRIVDLTSASTGIHTLQKNTSEFFAFSVLDRHNDYQRLTLAGVGSTANFVSGREITQTVVGGTAVGIAVTYNQTTRQLLVSVELSSGTKRNFAISNGTTVLNITDHSNTPIGVGVTVIAGVSTYWSTNTKIDSTLPGQTIQGVQNLPENFKLHWHRPSIINSSSHTWEYSGSGIDYNALPQNGGKTDTATEQVSERGGRVFSSGTNELGDFKIGDFITAFNRTGNIIFNNTVTIGTLDSLRLSLSGGISIEEFSTDSGLGDNELGGPQNRRVPTQLATRSFLNSRLGGFIDKSVSTNAVPNAIVQLNAIGQINADLIPPKVSNFYRTPSNFGRLLLHNQIPALNIGNGDTVVEPQSPYVLISDTYSQYIILNNNTVYNFENGDIVRSVLNQGSVTGIVTAPPFVGVNTNLGITTNTGLSFNNVGYGTTGLVRGVALTLKNITGGSGYNSAGIYTGVRFDTASGIGTGITGTITVSAAGTVQAVAINTGGRYFSVNDTLTINDPTPIGGRTGGSNFTVQIASVETRLYVNLLDGVKFTPTTALPDYFADRNAVAISTNVSTATTSFSFTATGIDVGGNVDFANNRITSSFLPFGDGDPVKYTTTGTEISPLLSNEIYYVKKVGISSYTIHTNYSVSSASLIDLDASATGTHTFTRVGFRTETNQIVVVNHGFSQGDPVQINAAAGLGTLTTGLTTGYYYFVGSATTNSFTLHESRNSALASSGGLILDEIGIGTNGSGIVSFTKQNVSFTSVVNTSGQLPSNWVAVGGGDIDASNIISGVISPTRLAGSGSANNETFLRGDSQWAKAVSSIGIGTTQPFAVLSTSSDLAPAGVGINTYYGNVQLSLNRVLPTGDLYSTLGVARFKSSTFTIGSDGTGTIQIKTAAGGGDVDAATLGGNNSAYHLDVTNHQGTVPLTRGGTGLTGLPPNGSLLIGNGTAYTLTTTPTLQGLLTTQSIAVGANHDISFTTGTWTGEKAGKIQFTSNSLYLQFTTNLIGRNASGTDVFTLGNGGGATFTGALQGTRFTSTVTTGTAPFTVSSTTEVSNLNSALLNGFASDTANTASAIVRRDSSNQIFVGRLDVASSGSTTTPQINLNGTTNNWINFNTNGVAAPTFTTRSAGAKIVLYPAISASAADYALGIEGSTLWSGVPTTSEQFRWYGGTTLAATLSGAGALTLVGALSATTLTSTVATGTAPFTVSSTTVVTNLNADLLDGLNSATAATANTIVARDASGNITGARVDATTHRAATFDITADTNNRLQQGALILRNASPTIYLRDTDHNVSMIHCNSNIFYVLRGSNDTETWTQVNSVWPLQIDLTNNNATFGGTVTASSDVRFKKNIATIQDALDKILNIRGVTFERLETPGTEIGVIAQEIEKVVPEIVTTDANGHKSVAYANITALLIEAIKEQQVQINELRDEIKKLKGE